MAKDEVGIGVVGYGMMGKAHSYAYTAAPVMRPLPHRPRPGILAESSPSEPPSRLLFQLSLLRAAVASNNDEMDHITSDIAIGSPAEIPTNGGPHGRRSNHEAYFLISPRLSTDPPLSAE